ncbi:hypothetical protein Q5Y73_04100 [Chengkuizengella sp. 2205SS18-9]|uniref:Uncharacterized protein n=2 Tax=Chengkuizengella axinellae TaxID=3064388 RepID=A0ABT9IV85_9BACL|nr:S-Ena type endospore appendage [Chengkuizengella sp. 2205SS18-9]MDP5273274.1 hypothetical protein [Chengkuizengella sp. 2205SS18-9]
MPTPIFVGEKTSGISLPSGAITVVNTSETCTMQVAIEVLSSMTPLITEIEPRSSFTTTLADIIRIDILCAGPMTDTCTGTVQLDLVFTVSTKLDKEKVKHNLQKKSFYDARIHSLKTNYTDRIEVLEPYSMGKIQLENKRNAQLQEKTISKEMSKIVDKLDHQLKKIDSTIQRRDELFLKTLQEMSENHKILTTSISNHEKPKKIEETIQKQSNKIEGVMLEEPKMIIKKHEVPNKMEFDIQDEPKKVEEIPKEKKDSDKELKAEVSKASTIEKNENKKRRWWQKWFGISMNS